MALAVAALRATGPVTIEEAQAIGKSYPRFFDDLSTMGAEVRTNSQGSSDGRR
jgi:3-phosphoshikimate 1-carboxyvinyltransferase